MKRRIVRLAALAALSTCASLAQAQDIYAGLGLPGLYTIGYAHPVGSSWGLRGEYAGGLSRTFSGSADGVDYQATLKASRAGVFADWFPFGGGFRFVGGVSSNDIKADVNSVGTSATINGKPVSLSGHYFNLNIKYPTVTPYLGIGYGHQANSTKGLGFYFDLGLSFGSFTADVQTDLVGVSGITQADVDQQKKDMNSTLAGVTVLPSASLGLRYNF